MNLGHLFSRGGVRLRCNYGWAVWPVFMGVNGMGRVTRRWSDLIVVN